MKKEPLLLYLIRLLLLTALLILLLLIYWSTNSIETDIKSLQEEVGKLQEELKALPSQPIIHQGITAITKPSAHIDPNLPNLLTEDPFYTTTLPKMLGDHFKPKGTFKSDTLGKPDNLHPFSNWSRVAEWMALCTVSVSRLQFGKYETMAPNMAVKLEERRNKETGEVEFWVHLRDQVYWQPLKQAFFTETQLSEHFLKPHQVTAEDYKFYFDAVMNPFVQESGAIALRTYLSDIKEIQVVDPLTFIVRWKGITVKNAEGQEEHKIKYVAKNLTGSLQPLASFVYKYFSDGTKIVENDAEPDTYQTNSIWAQNFNQHWAKNIIVSCGAWSFDGMTERQIRFKRNPNHYFPYDALAEAMEVNFKETTESIWDDFKANKIDTYDLRPEDSLEVTNFQNSPLYQKQLKNNNGFSRIDFVARSYTYIGWNQAKRFFKAKKVRQALTMAIDRERIIRQNLNGMGIQISAPFYRYSPAYDPTIAPWPYDVQQAKRLLEEEGWVDSDGDGVIDKDIDGKKVPFRFALTYFVKSPTAKAIAEYVATAMKEIGIECSLRGLDIADLSATFDDKNFDAILFGWALGSPPEDPRQLWYSSGAKEKGSSNAIGFQNAEVDQIIDQLQYEADPAKRIALYHRFDAIIHEETPYTLLYNLKSALLYRNYVQNVFIPADRQDLIPGANMTQPDSSIFWLKH